MRPRGAPQPLQAGRGDDSGRRKPQHHISRQRHAAAGRSARQALRQQFAGDRGRAAIVRLVQLRRLPQPWRRRHGPGADGRRMALRRLYRPDRRDHRRWPPERNAVVARKAYRRPDLEAGGLCAQLVRPAEQGRRRKPRGIDEHERAGNAHPARARPVDGHRPAMRLPRRIAALCVFLLLGACSVQTYQSIFSGDAAEEVRQFNILFLIFLAVCAIMYLAVIGFLAAGIVRRRRPGAANVVETGRHREDHPLMRSLLVGWTAVVSIGLVILAIASFVAARSMARAAAYEKLSIEVTANQWRWDVRYNSDGPSKMIRTANELHLPVGVPV